MYRLVNYIRKEFKLYVTTGRDSIQILIEGCEIVERWRHYFENLLREHSAISTEITQELGEELE